MYIKITKAPVTVKTDSSTFWSPNGLLPYLVADGKKYAGFKNIATYLASQDFVLNKANNGGDFEDSYVTVLRQNLYPYFMYNQWCPQNIDHSRTLYAKRIPFPFNFISPKDYFRRTDRLVQNLYRFSLEDAVDKHDISEMALKAKQVLNELEERLNTQDWAAGKEPTILDVHVYAFAALALHNSLPNNALQSHIQQCPSLVKYVQRITKLFFAHEGFNTQEPQSGTQKEQPEKKFYTGQEDDDDPKDRRRRYIISSLVATISMISFAIFKGILHVSFSFFRCSLIFDLIRFFENSKFFSKTSRPRENSIICHFMKAKLGVFVKISSDLSSFESVSPSELLT